jgi:hypothetical protein
MSQPVHKVFASVRTTHGPDGGTVLDTENGRMYGLNYVGSRILDLLTSGLRQIEIVDRIQSEFAIDRRTAENDVQDFLLTLQQRGLIEAQPA